MTYRASSMTGRAGGAMSAPSTAPYVHKEVIQMENVNTSPKEVCVLLDSVFRVLIAEQDQKTFNLLLNVVEEILHRSKQSMDEVVRLN